VAVVILVAGVATISGRRMTAASWALGAASVWLAAATSWYASDWALVVALPASGALLLAFTLVSMRAIRAVELERGARASVEALREVPAAVADTWKLPGRSVEHARGGVRGVMRGAMIGVPLSLLFVLLLSADDRFRDAAGRLVLQSGSAVSFLLWMATCATGLLVMFGAIERSARGGDASAAVPVPARPYRIEGDSSPTADFEVELRSRPGITPLTLGIVLTHVVAVFGLFVVANAGTLFATDSHLRAHGTITYARYVHEGFTQVSIATLLAVACVAAGHALLRHRERSAHVPGGRALMGVELTLLVLVGITLASSAHRLSLYEAAYGYTYLRLGVWLLQIGVAGLLAMTAARCVARRWNGWTTALAWAAAAFLVLAGSIDADGWIARRNVERARGGGALDVEYLASLSEDARDTLPALRTVDPESAEMLEEAWRDSRARHHETDWRSARGLGSR
jgi:hypothetical protein